MSFNISAGEIKAAVFPTGVTKTPPSEYEVTEAKTLLCRIRVPGWAANILTYFKTNGGSAYVAFWEWNKHEVAPFTIEGPCTGPLLVSKNRDAVTYSATYRSTYDEVTDIESKGSFSYKGSTWYYSGTEMMSVGWSYRESLGGVAQYLGNFDSVEEAARHLLDLVFGT